MDFHHLISGLSAIEELKYRIYHAGDSKLGDTLLKIGYTIDPGAIVLKKILNKYLMLGEGKSAEEANQESFLLYRGTLEGIATATVDLGAGLIQAPANILNLLGAILADGGSGKLGTQMVNDLHASLLQTVETLKTGSARDKGHVIGTTLLNLVTIVLGGAGASKKLKGVSKLDDLENVDDLGKLGNLDNVDDLGKLKNIDNMEGSALVDDVGKGVRELVELKRPFPQQRQKSMHLTQ